MNFNPLALLPIAIGTCVGFLITGTGYGAVVGLTVMLAIQSIVTWYTVK